MAQTAARRRLLRDFRKLQTDPPNEGAFFCLTARRDRGPERRQHHGVERRDLRVRIRFLNDRPDDTEWEGGTFELKLVFTEDYPNKAPKVTFTTKMFHPNSSHSFLT